MARYTGPVCKLCRREGVKLFLKGEKCYTKCVFEKRPTPPGPPKKKLRSKMTEYAVRLREKQKLRRMVGVTETPFRRVYGQAAASPTNTGEEFLRLLEVRLDNVVRRMGFSSSLKTARQMVLHGHIKVNGKTVNIPSFSVDVEDTIALDPRMKENLIVKVGLQSATRRSGRPSFLAFNEAEMSGQLLRWPTRQEMTFPVQEHLIVEHYSK